MSEEPKEPLDGILIGIAWAQFIAVSAAVDKADLRNVRGAWDQILLSPWAWQWDWTRFGSVAVALNVLALCLLTVPALGRSLKWKVFKGRPAAVKAFYDKLREFGFYSWLVSFIAFIGYLNFMSVVCVYIATAAVLILLIYYRYSKQPGEKS
jgi:hypothetical protein